MASNVRINGFRVWGTMSGGEGVIPGALVRPVANNYATQINKGDLIIPVSDGTVAQAATNSTTLLGVVTGCSFVSATPPTAGKRVVSDFIPANTTFTPTTVGSPNESLVQYVPLTGEVILEVDLSGTTVNTVAGRVGLIGENCAYTTNGTASTVVGYSVMCLDDSSHVTTAQQFRIVGLPGYSLEGGLDLSQAGSGDATVAGFKVLVVCNQGFLPPFTTSGV
ncbi:MAG TPA: hypothetical protein VFL67_20010 [Mycobacterium sp.]|nr:hypothetical protein [Mycobacterium sp.]